MSSSPSRAPAPPAQETEAEPQVSAFLYSEAILRAGPVSFSSPAPATSPEVSVKPESAGASDAEREAQWRDFGRKQGIAESKARFDEQLAQERDLVAKAVAEFSRERAAYYRKIEEEAVRLALSIARKILHRESSLDPLLLMGVVRVALDRIEGATEVTLLVNPKNAAEWLRFSGAQETSGERLEVVEDASVPPGQCVLKTSMGTAELGIELQLQEIETGLMDLLAARPGGNGKGEVPKA